MNDCFNSSSSFTVGTDELTLCAVVNSFSEDCDAFCSEFSIDQGLQVTVGTDGNKLVGVINGTTPPGGGGTTPPGGGGTAPGAGSLYADADAKSPVETQSAAFTMLNLGHDLLTTAGYENAALAVDGEEEGSVNPFITMSANNHKLDTGSHVDLKAWNMNLGFAKKINNNSGKLIIAPVIEYGRGSYDSYLDNGTPTNQAVA